MKMPLCILAFSFAGAGMMLAQAPVTEDLPIGFLPQPWVNAALRKSLSPQGRATMVSPTGPVRVADVADRVAAAKSEMSRLLAAPALVPLDVTFATMAQRIVQTQPVEPPVLGYGIPVPNRYDPPRIIAGPGGVTVVPAQPRDFTTRNVGPGTVVNPAVTGYRTLTPEVNIRDLDAPTTATVNSPAGARRFAASTVLGKAVTLPVLRNVADPAALRALAVRFGAVSEIEPVWTGAATELVLTPEPSGAAVMVKVVPMIVFPPSGPGRLPRRVPISACMAGVMVAPGATTQTGILPKTDPEFYRVFFGMPQAAEDTVTAMTLTANVQYVGSPPE